MIAEFSQGIQIEIENQSETPFEDSIRFIRIVDYSKNGDEKPRYIKSVPNRYIVNEKDLVMIRYGSQTAGLVVRGLSGAIANNTFKINLNQDLIINNFCYYFLKQDIVFNFLRSSQSSSTMPAITFEMVSSLQIPIPPLPTQKAIAHILGTLDDKIELLRQMNETLEEMAKALFKSWFVDFEPVRKKADGLKTGLPKEIEDMFPSEFEDSELGEIPKGWKVGKLGDVLDTISITHKFPKGKVIFLNTSDILNGGFLHSNYSDSSKLPGQAKKTINEGDILFSEIRPENKRFAFVNFKGEDYVVSTKLMVLRNKFGNSNVPFYFLLKSNEILKELQIQAESRSGTFPQITFDNVKILKYIVATDKVSNIYLHNLEKYFDSMNQFNIQITQLSQIRDTLLPKLISGELELTDKMIEKILEEAK